MSELINLVNIGAIALYYFDDKMEGQLLGYVIFKEESKRFKFNPEYPLLNLYFNVF